MTPVGAAARAFTGVPILVTGGAGFLGSNLAHALVEAGAQVTLADCLEPGSGGNLRNLAGIESRVRLLRADLRDPAQAKEAVEGAAVVFHLAGQVSHVVGNDEPQRDLLINALATLNVMDAAAKSPAKPRVVHAASRSQYGRIESSPVEESHPLRPTDANGVSKSAAEMYALYYARVHGLRAVSLRLTNTYGPRHVMAHNKQGVLGWFVRQALDDQTIRLFGGGEQKRDVLFVDDAVEALLLAAREDSLVGLPCNVGGASISLRAFAEKLVAIAGRGRVESVPHPPEWRGLEIGDYEADSSLFRKRTGWGPRTSLDEGIRRTVQYYERERAHYWS